MEAAAAQHEPDLARQRDPVAAERHEQLVLEEPAGCRRSGRPGGHDPDGRTPGHPVEDGAGRLWRVLDGRPDLRHGRHRGLGRRGTQLSVGGAEPCHGRAEHLGTVRTTCSPSSPRQSRARVHRSSTMALTREWSDSSTPRSGSSASASASRRRPRRRRRRRPRRVPRGPAGGPHRARRRPAARWPSSRRARQGWSGPLERDARDRDARARARPAARRRAPGCRRPGCAGGRTSRLLMADPPNLCRLH